MLLACGRMGAASDIQFNRDVRPILADKCLACHGPDATTREADLRLDEPESAHLVLGMVEGEQSALETRITSTDPDQVMPPRSTKKRLTRREIDVLTRWIAAGAEYEPHWAFIRPVRHDPPPVPARQDAGWPRNPIDHFVLDRLDDEGLTPSREADRERLLRRVTLDLTGLAPTPAEVDAYLADQQPGAYERVVDRLLASPRYGEHMASFWLDAARYADTDGYQNDRLRYMHVWRDWVIRALNDNQPFDRFTIEQLAGDMLPDATLNQQIATGFGRNHRINSEGGSIPEEWAVEYVVDRVDTLGTVWLGLTVGCARCHEHKFDPLTQVDYYRLFAYFNNVPEWGLGPNNGNSPPFVTVPAGWPNLTPVEDRAQTPPPLELSTTQTSVVRPQPGNEQTVMVMHEHPQPRPTYVLRRGLYNQPDRSQVVDPAIPQGLVPGRPEAGDDAGEPRNRLELAQWLVQPDHPLTARVTVNRYWQQFFGTGLVRTSENFGLQGEPPTHPELLDWLATEFVRLGWDVKALQRLIVSSATYRQSSTVTAELAALDPENRWLARGPRFRTGAFAVRDQALAAAGLLIEEIGGPSVKPYMPPNLWESISNNKYVQDHGARLYRRSLYTYWRRTIPPPTMATFNAAERETCIVRKDRTNTPLQALTLMNNVTFVEAARFLAERMLTEVGPRIEHQLAHGFRCVLARDPRDDEQLMLEEAHEQFRSGFSGNTPAAEQFLKVGEKPRDPSLDAIDHAAMTMVASLILNLDEAITKE
jgi:hypothetical protein